MKKNISQEINEKQFLDVNGISKMLKVSKTTIYSWTHSRKIPFTRVGSRLLFNVNKILQWLDDNSCDVSEWWEKRGDK